MWRNPDLQSCSQSALSHPPTTTATITIAHHSAQLPTRTTMPDSAALVAHIVSQTRQNIQFLISQNELSPLLGNEILSKLPSASEPSILALSDATRRMTIPEPTPQREPSPVRSSYTSPPPQDFGPPVRRTMPPQAQPRLSRAKALWSYNENGQVCPRLSLSSRSRDWLSQCAWKVWLADCAPARYIWMAFEMVMRRDGVACFVFGRC